MDGMIKITHFVNPHKFYFKWLSDEVFDKPLDEMEMKIKGTASKKKEKEGEEEGEIQIGDTCGVFIPDWNRWIRCLIKAKDKNGAVYVWAYDYGLPFISKQSQIVKLPPMYTKMNIKYQRIHVGGIANCVPAESGYDIDTDRSVLNEQPNWSANAIEIAQGIFARAIHLRFEDYREVNLENGAHLFGRLIVQKSDGTSLDLAKSLSNAVVAKIKTEDWGNHVHKLQTINQKEWLAINGTPLQSKIIITPISSDQIVKEIAEVAQSKGQRPYANAAETKQHKDINQNDQTNNSRQSRFSSVQENRPFNKRSSSITRNIRSVPNQNFRSPKLNFNNNYARRNNHDDYSSQFPHGWHSNGRLKDHRYREEIEYFESSFRKPSAPVQKDDPSLDNSTEEPKVMETIEKIASQSTSGSDEKSPIKTESIDEASVGNKPTDAMPGKMDIILNGGVTNDDQQPKNENTKTKQNEGNAQSNISADN